MLTHINVPGIYGSGPTHWQTHWEADPQFVRFSPSDWDAPDRADWIAALDEAVRAAPEPPVLVAHSLACLLVPMWAEQSHAPVAGAFMVAPPDPARPSFPAPAWEFADVPRKHLRFPSMMVASADDHYADLPFVLGLAGDLGSQLTVAGSLGHINADSELGDWPQGRQLLAEFVAGLDVG